MIHSSFFCLKWGCWLETLLLPVAAVCSRERGQTALKDASWAGDRTCCAKQCSSMVGRGADEMGAGVRVEEDGAERGLAACKYVGVWSGVYAAGGGDDTIEADMKRNKNENGNRSRVESYGVLGLKTVPVLKMIPFPFLLSDSFVWSVSDWLCIQHTFVFYALYTENHLDRIVACPLSRNPSVILFSQRFCSYCRYLKLIKLMERPLEIECTRIIFSFGISWLRIVDCIIYGQKVLLKFKVLHSIVWEYLMAKGQQESELNVA